MNINELPTFWDTITNAEHWWITAITALGALLFFACLIYFAWTYFSDAPITIGWFMAVLLGSAGVQMTGLLVLHEFWIQDQTQIVEDQLNQQYLLQFQIPEVALGERNLDDPVLVFGTDPNTEKVATFILSKDPTGQIILTPQTGA